MALNRAGFKLASWFLFPAMLAPAMLAAAASPVAAADTPSTQPAASIQPLPSIAPLASSQPTSTSAPVRYAITIPPGFHLVTLAGHSVICQPPDDAWVREVLAGIQPPTRPSTMPADLLSKLTDQRSEIEKEMIADMALPDPKVADDFFDKTLFPLLHTLDQMHPPVFYLVCTKDKLTELLKSGWQDPRFHYNRFGDNVEFDMGVRLSIDSPLDDTIMPSVFSDKTPVADKKDLLTKTIQFTDLDVINSIASQGPPLTRAKIIDFIGTSVLAPLNLKPDQQWLGFGVMSYLSCKYISQMSGISFPSILAAATANTTQANPLSSDAIDALHPLAMTDLKPQYAGLYLDALNRKSTQAIAYCVEKGGKDAIGKIMAAVRKQLPADGPGLVKQVKDATGVDLTPKLSQ